MLKQLRDNFTDYNKVQIRRTTKERSFWRRWGGDAKKVGPYGAIGNRSAKYARNKHAILEEWGNTLENQTRFRIRKGSLLIEGPAAPQEELSGLGHQLLLPNHKTDLFIP